MCAISSGIDRPRECDGMRRYNFFSASTVSILLDRLSTCLSWNAFADVVVILCMKGFSFLGFDGAA